MEKKQRLIEALKKERDRMSEKFGTNPREHNLAIEYLETGKTDEDPDKHDLLDAAMNDYETLASDYDVD